MSRRITLTVQIEADTRIDNRRLMKDVKPALELALKRAAPPGVRVKRTIVTLTKD